MYIYIRNLPTMISQQNIARVRDEMSRKLGIKALFKVGSGHGTGLI